MRSLLAYSEGTTQEEKISLRVKADTSGNLYIPVAGYSTEGTQDCEYNWNISIDGGANTIFNGVGSAGKITAGYGYKANSIHTIKITPVVEEYGWLRAFGYRNSGAESYLINIISDLSYKGFALSNIFTGDYYKYSQYYGCLNLINTDEEQIPDSVEIIGDNYRAYEYYGCSTLKRGADEKVLKNVRVIGNYYRANQYENCTGINRMDIRAINRATIGTNYRNNQFSGMGNIINPYDLYIEGGIVDGGSLGIDNDKVDNIYVFSQLVSDYQTKLSSITSSKIKTDNRQSNRNHEYIEIKMKANANGKINIPVAGYSTAGSQNCAYDWKITIGTTTETITGTGSATNVEVGSGLTAGNEYRVIIEPTTVAYGWARAFGFHNSGAESYITEFIHDSYKCWATNYNTTGDYFKYKVFIGCTNLENSYERMPSSVETIGNYCYTECYSGCTSLEEAHWEVLPNITTLGTNYREKEYYNCSSLETHLGIAGTLIESLPTSYKSQMMDGAGNNMDIYMTRAERVGFGLVDNNVRYAYMFVNDIYSFYGYHSGIINKCKARYYGYKIHQYYNINDYTYNRDANFSNYPYQDYSPYWVGGVLSEIRKGYGVADCVNYATSSYTYSSVGGFKCNNGIGDVSSFTLEYRATQSQSSRYDTIYHTYSPTSRGDFFLFVQGTGHHSFSVAKVDSKTGTILQSKGLSVSDQSSSYAYPKGGFMMTPNGQFMMNCSEDDNYSGENRQQTIWIYKLSTPRDLSTATVISHTRASGTVPAFYGALIRFSDDGLDMYVGNKHYKLTVPFMWWIASYSLVETGNVSVSSFSHDGKRMYSGVKQYIHN